MLAPRFFGLDRASHPGSVRGSGPPGRQLRLSDRRRFPSDWGVSTFLYAIRRVSALIGIFLLGLQLPVWAQQLEQRAREGAAALVDGAKQVPANLPGAITEAAPVVAPAVAPGVASGVAPTLAPAAAAPAASRLMDSFELCKIGRLGQHELSFLTVFILIGCFVFFIQIDRRLIRHGWEIKKALSEPNALSYFTQDSSATPVFNEKGEPITVNELVPSVSRLIALAGLIMLILFYFGFGIISIYHFGRTCEMPGDINGVTAFLYAGLTFFAPYIATKFSEIFAPGARRLPLPSVRPEDNLASDVTRSGPSPQPAPAAARSLAPSSTAVPATRIAATPPAPVGTAPASVGTPPAPAPVHAVSPAAVLPGPSMNGHSDALKLIIEFEGFRDKAYPDPATGGDPWTIGYGFTRVNGHPVVPGQSLSRPEADQLLSTMVGDCANHLSRTIPFWTEMSGKQQSCLLSFAWNLGQDFYGNESDFHTITKCLREKDWAKVPDALLLYCMPGTPVHQGLLRRRQAEADLWRQGMASPAVGLNAGSPVRPIAAGGMPSANAVTAPASAPVAVAAPAHPNPLQVAYFDQMLMDDGQGWRDCFSASCAMLACYWGKLKDANAYNHIRAKYGDSTDSNAQLQALRSLGLKAEFRTNGKPETLKAEIDAGRPVAVGWLHHGSVSAPSGGGHWTVVIGYDSTGFWMNDPYGSCDLVGGGYPGGANPNDTLGKKEHYSTKNWLPRWMPGGSEGWYLTCSL
jgi:GH24 family phage-related lysozyme (muramidase)